MRIGTRITLTTTALVISALVLYALVSVGIRRAELLVDLERQTQSVGDALQISLEAALQEGLYEDVRRLVLRIQQAERSLAIAYVELPGAAPIADRPAADRAALQQTASDGGVAMQRDAGAATQQAEADEDARYVPPGPDAARDGRIRRLVIDGRPFGEHVSRGGPSSYAYTVPIRDEDGRVVAAVDLVRDEADAERALRETERNVAVTVVLLGLGLAALVWLTTERAFSHPIGRLVEGIDEVAHGDLTRVILREGDDEIGDLADRFNQMTTSLREAKAETERGVETRLTLEARLRQSEKLATVGQLAASIAHEVGTPLGVIGGRARTMEKKAHDPAEVTKNASIIAAQTARITKIIERLLDYARKKGTPRGPFDLAQVARDTVDFLEHQLSAKGVTVRVRTEGDAIVQGDSDELQQVCLNLLMNAIQSMPSGGAIDVALSTVRRRRPGLDLAPPSPYVALEVTDEGVGIRPEDRERIFEPFYSTKQGDGGTGLGLAVSLGIVKDHDGWIEIEAGARGGTVFRVYLPQPDGADAHAPPDEAAHAAVAHANADAITAAAARDGHAADGDDATTVEDARTPAPDRPRAGDATHG